MQFFRYLILMGKMNSALALRSALRASNSSAYTTEESCGSDRSYLPNPVPENDAQSWRSDRSDRSYLPNPVQKSDAQSNQSNRSCVSFLSEAGEPAAQLVDLDFVAPEACLEKFDIPQNDKVGKVDIPQDDEVDKVRPAVHIREGDLDTFTIVEILWIQQSLGNRVYKLKKDGTYNPQTGREYEFILKTIPRTGREYEDGMLYREINMLETLDHRRLMAGAAQGVQVFRKMGNGENILVDDKEVVAIVCPYAEQGDLAQVIANKQKSGGKFEESEILKYFVQILDGLTYMHGKKQLHRDIKPKNIFVGEKDTVMIGDFGFCCELKKKEDLADGDVWTPGYQAPELSCKAGGRFPSDVYSVGCCLYEMATMKNSDKIGREHKNKNGLDESHRQIAESYKDIMLKGVKEAGYSKELQELLRSMVLPDPDHRKTAPRLLDQIRRIQRGRDAAIMHIRSRIGSKSCSQGLPTICEGEPEMIAHKKICE